MEDAQWNPGENYLLVCYQDNRMRLFEAGSEKASFEFDPQGIGVRCIAWVNDMSGDFVTCTDKVGAIRVWAASQKTHKAVLKVGATGIRSISGFGSRPELFLIGFKDGAMGIYDLKKRRLVWQIEAGHTETIFDVRFKPNNCNLLATSSFDGLVKIWDMSTMKVAANLSQQHVKGATPEEAENVRIIYSVSWAPGDDTRLATSNANGEVIIWDYVKNKVLCKIQPGSAGQISRVEWHPLMREILACGSVDSKAFVLKLTDNRIEVLTKLSHGGAVNGVSWNLFKKYQGYTQHRS